MFWVKYQNKKIITHYSNITNQIKSTNISPKITLATTLPYTPTIQSTNQDLTKFNLTHQSNITHQSMKISPQINIIHLSNFTHQPINKINQSINHPPCSSCALVSATCCAVLCFFSRCTTAQFCQAGNVLRSRVSSWCSMARRSLAVSTRSSSALVCHVVRVTLRKTQSLFIFTLWSRSHLTTITERQYGVRNEMKWLVF